MLTQSVGVPVKGSSGTSSMSTLLLTSSSSLVAYRKLIQRVHRLLEQTIALVKQMVEDGDKTRSLAGDVKDIVEIVRGMQSKDDRVDELIRAFLERFESSMQEWGIQKHRAYIKVNDDSSAVQQRCVVSEEIGHRQCSCFDRKRKAPDQNSLRSKSHHSSKLVSGRLDHAVRDRLFVDCQETQGESVEEDHMEKQRSLCHVASCESRNNAMHRK